MTKIKAERLINLGEKLSRQPNAEAVTWLLLGAFSQTYVTNQGQTEQQDNLKHCEFSQKKNSSKAVDCKDRSETLTAKKHK